MVIRGKALGYPGEYCPLQGSKAKNPRACGPPWVLASELLRDNIHQDTPLAFPHIVSNTNKKLVKVILP